MAKFAQDQKTGERIKAPGRILRLDESTQAQVRRGFGIDPGELELGESPEVRAMGARAVAQGNVIRFAPGEFSPGTAEGRAVLGHELAHVRSQALGEVPMTGGLLREPGYEAAADRAGDAFATGTLGSPGPVDAGALAGQNAPAQGLFGWAKKIGKNFRLAQKEGREQKAAMGYQNQMNENLRQGENLSLDDQLANAQYRRDNLPGMRRGMADLRHDTAVEKWDASYEQGRGGIGRWLGKRLFQSKAGAGALASMRGQASDQTDWGAQAAGLQGQVDQRDETLRNVATYRYSTFEQQNAARDEAYASGGAGHADNTYSRIASAMKFGGTQEDQQYNIDQTYALASLGTGEQNKPENYEKIWNVLVPYFRQMLNTDIESLLQASDDELMRRFPELCDMEKPSMFFSDSIKGVTRPGPDGKAVSMYEEAFTPEERDRLRRKKEILNSVVHYCETKAVLAQPQITEMMVQEGNRTATLAQPEEQAEIRRKLRGRHQGISNVLSEYREGKL